jgi:hypothetical protein
VLPPVAYDITCDKCGGTNIYWSEFEKKIWCFDCKIDTDGTGGIFYGPIPIHAAYMLGLTFDRFNLKTKQVERFNLDKNTWDPPEVYEKISGPKEVAKRLLKDGKTSDVYGDMTSEAGSKYFKLVRAKKGKKK